MPQVVLAGEFARGDDGDRFCEVHVSTMEGFWSLLRSWVRPIGGSRKSDCRCTWVLRVRAQRPELWKTNHRVDGRTSSSSSESRVSHICFR